MWLWLFYDRYDNTQKTRVLRVHFQVGGCGRLARGWGGQLAACGWRVAGWVTTLNQTLRALALVPTRNLKPEPEPEPEPEPQDWLLGFFCMGVGAVMQKVRCM